MGSMYIEIPNWIEEERYSSDLAQEICDKNKLAHGKGLKLRKRL